MAEMYCPFLFVLIKANSQIIPQTWAGCLAKAAQNEMFLYVRKGKNVLWYTLEHMFTLETDLNRADKCTDSQDELIIYVHAELQYEGRFA